MAQRSTRNKIKWQAAKLQNQLDRMLVHLHNIDELAEGKSEVINTWMPRLVQVVEVHKTLIGQFQADL